MGHGKSRRVADRQAPRDRVAKLEREVPAARKQSVIPSREPSSDGIRDSVCSPKLAEVD